MLKRLLSGMLAVVLFFGLFVGMAQPANAASALESSDKLIEVIKTMEGFAKKPYWDMDHWAIGYGTSCPDDKLNEYKKEGISKTAATKLLKKDLSSREDAINNFANKYGLKLEQQEFDALVSFTYNCGSGWLSDTSGYFNKAVRKGDTSNAFLYGICLWSSAGGEYILLKRRLCEANMYINGVYKASNSGDKDLYPDNFRWVFLDGNGGEPEHIICAFDADKPKAISAKISKAPTGKDKDGNKFTYTLAGWYTEGGKKVSKLNDSLEAGTVLYAKWEDPEGNIVDLPKGGKPEMERVVVTAASVNVRKGPGTYYEKVGTASEGEILTLTEVYEAGSNIWGHFADGWISLSYTNYDEAPIIVSHPKSKEVACGEEIKVSLDALGKNITYKWYYKDVGDSKYTLDDTVTGDTYAMIMSENSTGRKVYCTIADKYGNKVKSRTATLGMEVSISKQPESAQAENGKKAKISVTATGDGLTYQWYYKNPGSSEYKASSIKTAKGSVTMTDARDGRKMYCIITDQYGNEVKTKTVTLGMKVSISKQPEDTSAEEGKKVNLSVTATGDDLTYKWYYRNAGASKFKACSGTGKATYSIRMTQERTGREMYCVITDKYGNSVRTDTVTIGVDVFISKQPKSAQAQDGDKVKTSVTAVGDDLSYQWYYKNPGSGKFKKSSTQKATYSVTMSDKYAGRQVYCVITDKYGNKVKSKTVTLGMEVSISKQPKSVNTENGQKTKVKVTASGDGLTYKWYVKDVGDSKYTRDKLVTGKTYSVKMSSSVSGRKVYCKITDKYGNSVKTKKVTLGMEVSISKQPKTTSAEEGKKVKLNVSATGDGLTYKWYYRNAGASKFKACSGTGKATYSIRMTDSRAGRKMYCVITDKYGNEVKTKTVTLKMK